MTDAYAYARERVASTLETWNTGAVTLTRSTPGTPNPATPWMPATPTLDVYTLDARVDGVAAEYVNNTTILATDLLVIASPKATHTHHAGSALDPVETVDIVPRETDKLTIDGAEKIIKKIEAVPAAGLAARFHIFIAS